MTTPAKACHRALHDATLMWPKRNRAKDGIMGDHAHQQRNSDHNSGDAFDLTHDPKNGVDCHVLADLVTQDPRVTYVIWNRRIYNRDIPGGWRPYHGPSPHSEHMHVSIRHGSRDALGAWPWSQHFAEWLNRRDRQFPPPPPLVLRVR
jgi:hypothetical protein